MSPGNTDRAQGTAVGAGGGALAGAAIGGAIGGWRGAAIGAAGGLLVGALVGYNWGKHVALKKEKYASEEAYLNASIQNAQALDQAATAENKKLEERIARDETQTQQLLAEYQANQATADDLKSRAGDIARQQADLRQKIARIDDEITMQRQVMDTESQNGAGNAQQLTQIDAEIQNLEQQKEQLQQSNQRLEELSNRLSV